jgi:hypothetical protein
MIDSEINKVDLLVKTIKGFFPHFYCWIKKLKDPRMVNKNTYHLSVMFWIGVLMFILKLGSSRNINLRLKKTSLTTSRTSFPSWESLKIPMK